MEPDGLQGAYARLEDLHALGLPCEAARGAARVHLALSDDAAVDGVLESASKGFGHGVLVVDHTTTSPTGTALRAARLAERGIAFQHAPVFMGPQNALESTGIMLASGDKGRFHALLPELQKMTGKVLYLGPEPERAASFKLFGNMFLMFMTTGAIEVLTFAKAVGVKPEEAAAPLRRVQSGGDARPAPQTHPRG